MDYDVKANRAAYIGGSDLPCIMGLSPFKTRWQLLLEKAELVEDDFAGNKYTEYGNIMEDKIRDYINDLYHTNFIPNRKYIDVLRFHVDGDDGNTILEIKTTSHIHEDTKDYKIYLVQLLAYMNGFGYEKGILAVYNRPDDFSTSFYPARLQIHEIKISEYKILIEQINAEIERFQADLAKLKENPLLTEEDLQPREIVALSNKVLELENQMQEYKAIEKNYKDMKKSLFEAMTKYNIKSWQMYNGTKITRVDPKEESIKTILEFDENAFKKEHEELYNLYLKSIEKKSSKRNGFIKITCPKE